VVDGLESVLLDNSAMKATMFMPQP
jgi:hypothetical protein